ncbi:hypothetical protein PM082_020531 [Marasmius tenuissimus]|nr:hypothetical protein PM082_020531 [Marasmius tenuissimus]
MVDIVAIVVAALALLGTLMQAAVSGWLNLHSEERKRQDRVLDILAKYRDPLRRSAEDLSYKLINIHTSYVIGQFFAWVHILRHDTQFLMPPNTDSTSREINIILRNIRMTLLTEQIASPFVLWSGEQLAISEIMIVRDPKDDGGQVRCMGFATFCQKWKADKEFREWFIPIVEGLNVLGASTRRTDFERLQSFQHLLVDLLELLRDHRSTSDSFRCENAPVWCRCKACKANLAMHISTHSRTPIPMDIARGDGFERKGKGNWRETRVKETRAA